MCTWLARAAEAAIRPAHIKLQTSTFKVTAYDNYKIHYRTIPIDDLIFGRIRPSIDPEYWVQVPDVL